MMNHFIRKHLPLLLMVSLGILAGCQKTPEERLLGQWRSLEQVPEQGRGDENPAGPWPLLEMAFFEDGTCTFRLNMPVLFARKIPTLPCDWILSAGRLLKLEIRMPSGNTLVETYTVTFDGERLELEESDGTSTKFEPVPLRG